jgi:plasmid stabilization system protein ParE
MTYKFLPEAREELFAAALSYEQKGTGLGWRFRSEAAAAIERILFDPYVWRERKGGYRRVNLPVFPYYIAYFIRAEEIIIAAVAHAHRRPNYWKHRRTA